MKNIINVDKRVKRENDLLFGHIQEHAIKEILEDFFNVPLDQNDTFSVFDYSSYNLQIEVKTRRTTYSKYATTMIPQNKVDTAIRGMDKNKYIFVFNFTDGIYYIELTKDNIQLFNQNQYGGRRDRNVNEYYSTGYCYIPINILTKIPPKNN